VNKGPIPVTVQILEKEYRVACKPGEEEGLFASAKLLDARMREIRNGGRVIGADRIAVMAALNLAYELLELKQSREQKNDHIGKRLKSLTEKIETALQQNRQLEL